MDRREFIKLAAAGSLSANLGLAAPSLRRKYKAAIIGYTGHGNYGHGLDQLFNDVSGVEVVGLADPDPAGRAIAQRRSHARRTYADYREMLEKEHPDLVVVAPRWSTLHYERILAALQAGAHVFCEKPFTLTLAEADKLLALADKTGRKIVVAHQSRVSPSIPFLKRRLAEGVIGEVAQVRMRWNSVDRRHGGEDLLVLGIHQFHIARYLIGESPLWCSARVLQDGHEATETDIHPATEPGDGPVLGDEIEAMFAYPRGLNAYFRSSSKYPKAEMPYSMEFIGTRGMVRFNMGYILRLEVNEADDVWRPLPGDPSPAPADENVEKALANRRIVDDWLDAIERDREPVCSGRSAMQALEMVHGVFAAGLSRGRVAFPLRNRQHPLAAFSP